MIIYTCQEKGEKTMTENDILVLRTVALENHPMTINEIMEKTGLDFLDALMSADKFEGCKFFKGRSEADGYTYRLARWTVIFKAIAYLKAKFL
jgi:hypothetical protein